MKKIIMGLLSLVLLFIASSCKKDSNVEKFLLEGKEGIETAVELTAEDFDDMMDDDESFVFLLMPECVIVVVLLKMML